jgi:hypothetical protein
MNKPRRPLAPFLATLLLVGLVSCEPAGVTLVPTSAATARANTPQAGVAPTATSLPSTAGTPSEIEGVLEAEGNLPSLRFYVLTDQGERLNVLPWLPVEVMQPPAGQGAPPTMADWVGQKVKLRGSWVQSDSGLVFQVISAELG